MSYAFVNASDQYISLGSAVLTSLPITLACRFNRAPGSLTSIQGLMAIRSASEPPNHFYGLLLRKSDNRVFAFHGHVAQELAAATAAFDDDTWNSAGAILAGASSRFAWNNTTKSAEDTDFSSTSMTLGDTLVGNYRLASGAGADCKIADAAIWNVALTDAEWLSYHAGLSPLMIRPDALVYYSPLAAGDRAWGSVGLVGTEVNGPTASDDHPITVYPGDTNLNTPAPKKRRGGMMLRGCGC